MTTEVKLKKLIWKRWWFWAVAAFAIIIIASAGGGEKKETTPEQQSFQGQIQPKQAPQEEQKESTWHNVISFSEIGNSSNKNTQPFLIKGRRWRIKWIFQDSGEFGEGTNGLFILNIYRVGESVITDQISHSGLSTNNTSYIYEGEGKFYLKIRTSNAKSWSIMVEDLY